MLSDLIHEASIQVDPTRKGREFKNILCSFESLFDIDIGCVAYILISLKDSKYIKPEAYNYTPLFVQYKLVHRDTLNPLSIIFKDEYKDQIDNLYNELLEKKREDIIKLSYQTYLAVLVDQLRIMGGYTIEVECDSEYEKEKVSELGLSPVDYQENLDEYFTLILRSPKDLKDRIQFTGKTVYLWNTSINYFDMKKGVENEILTDEIIALMGQKNVIKMIDPYQYTEELDDNKED
jgi:hypothetical protein